MKTGMRWSSLAAAGAGVALTVAAAGGAPPGPRLERDGTLLLRSRDGHGGDVAWQIVRADRAPDGAQVSAPDFASTNALAAMVPGTVLNTLVRRGVYPDPYHGLNNARESRLIPDLSETGPAFYTYWFRAPFAVPAAFAGRRIWLQFDGINYRAEVWLNGQAVGKLAGMFQRGLFDVTDAVRPGASNVLAVLVSPVDVPGGFKAKFDKPRAVGENRNGGDGTMGRNVSMLMTVGWDFTFIDGIRDRNTGIWRDVRLFAAGPVLLQHPCVRSEPPAAEGGPARVTIEVDVRNAGNAPAAGALCATIAPDGIEVRQSVTVAPGQVARVRLAPEAFAGLVLARPRLWWPFNKGAQPLYELALRFEPAGGGAASDVVRTRFGINRVTSDRATPDQSRCFYVNGRRLFLHGSNWVPEAMCRSSEARTEAELRYTRQAGVNFLRFWGGGTTESDTFFDLCDELGILVWVEFWQSGDTQIPTDQALYRANVEDTVRRIRNHPCVAYYVSANERTADGIVPIKDLLDREDPTRGWQAGSETDGIHDGSPYLSVNPMWYYEDSASARGSRINGLCPEYGCPILPTVDVLREIMDAQDLWPINKTVWDYLDGGGFHLMTSDYRRGVEQYGLSRSIDEYACKAQAYGALAHRALWECWNRNRFEDGDRFATGLLFWYHNSPNPQTCGRLWDWSLEPTAALYFSQDAHEPVHAQFDFLKQTVSVNNETVRPVPGCRVTARVLDFALRERFRHTATVDLPADRFARDLFQVAIPQDITPVHFIRLDLADAAGKPLADTFYWRSNRSYQPKRTWTGPQFEGFEALAGLPRVRVAADVTWAAGGGTNACRAHVANPSTNLAFMVWLRLQHAADAKPVRPAFYADNFFSLLPGESRDVAIDCGPAPRPDDVQLVVDGWNVQRVLYRPGAAPRDLPAAFSFTPAGAGGAAAGVAVTSSGDESAELAAARAVDGDTQTRWASARTDSQWLCLDLGQPRPVSGVRLLWEAACAREYKIQVSLDGRQWQDVLHQRDGKGGDVSHAFAPATARYVRLLGIKRATTYGYSLWEFSAL